MVKENLDLNKRILDFDLNKFKQNQQHQQQQQQQQHLTNVVIDLKNRQDNLSTPLKPPDTETDRLSWNFFEEISDLDNQLRTNVTNNLHYTPAKLICNNQIDEDFQQSKTNGYVSSADIFSQPDVILKHQQFEEQNQQQQQQQNQPTFQFTSPTSTFKRKKLLQVQREQHQSEHKSQHLYNNKNSTNNNNNNNNNSVAEEEDSEAGTIYHNSLSPILNFNTVTVFTSKNHKTISCNSNSNSNSNNKSGNSNKEQSLTLKRNHIQSHNEPLEVASTLISTGSGVIVDKGNTLTTATLPNRTKRTDNTTNGRKLNATIGRLPDNGSTITSDDTKPVSGNQGTTRRLNSRRTMGTEGGSSQSSKMATGSGYMEKMETHLSLYGWRKKCLYAILVVLMLLITINLMLTFWILQVMEFSTEGMGLLKIIPGGVQLTGQTLIMDLLRASTIRSRHGQPIAIESSRNFSINTRDRNGVLENHLYLGHDKLECLATGFRINDTAGRNLFSVNRNEVTIGAHALKIDGEGGAVFRESVQTPHIRAEPGRELRLESPTRQLEITAAKDINLQSRAGGIDLSALEDIKLSALDGSLRLESSKILMPNLRTAQTPLPGATQNREHVHRVFQLCACANGKLFLAAPHSICAGDDSTVCR